MKAVYVLLLSLNVVIFGAVSAAGALHGSDALLTLNATSVSPAASSIHPKRPNSHPLILSPQTLSAAKSTVMSPMADDISVSLFSFGEGSNWSDLDSDQMTAKMLYAVKKDRRYFDPHDLDDAEDEDQDTNDHATGYSHDRNYERSYESKDQYSTQVEWKRRGGYPKDDYHKKDDYHNKDDYHKKDHDKDDYPKSHVGYPKHPGKHGSHDKHDVSVLWGVRVNMTEDTSDICPNWHRPAEEVKEWVLVFLEGILAESGCPHVDGGGVVIGVHCDPMGNTTIALVIKLDGLCLDCLRKFYHLLHQYPDLCDKFTLECDMRGINDITIVNLSYLLPRDHYPHHKEDAPKKKHNLKGEYGPYQYKPSKQEKQIDRSLSKGWRNRAFRAEDAAADDDTTAAFPQVQLPATPGDTTEDDVDVAATVEHLTSAFAANSTRKLQSAPTTAEAPVVVAPAAKLASEQQLPSLEVISDIENTDLNLLGASAFTAANSLAQA